MRAKREQVRGSKSFADITESEARELAALIDRSIRAWLQDPESKFKYSGLPLIEGRE